MYGTCTRTYLYGEPSNHIVEVVLEELDIVFAFNGDCNPSIISKTSDDRAGNTVLDVVDVYQEKDWSQNSTLGNTTDDRSKDRELTINNHSLLTVSKERFDLTDNFWMDPIKM